MERSARIPFPNRPSRSDQTTRRRGHDAVHPVLRLQQAIGNRATGGYLSEIAVQRKQFTEGSKQAPFQPTATAKAQARWVIGKSLHNQAIAAGTTVGKYTWNQVVGTGAGTLGYEKFKGKTYCGGRGYGNNDEQLPGGTTYSEWDVAEYVAGARGTDRVVIAATGTAYFTNNHYADFVQIRGI